MPSRSDPAESAVRTPRSPVTACSAAQAVARCRVPLVGRTVHPQPDSPCVPFLSRSVAWRRARSGHNVATNYLKHSHLRAMRFRPATPARRGESVSGEGTGGRAPSGRWLSSGPLGVTYRRQTSRRLDRESAPDARNRRIFPKKALSTVRLWPIVLDGRTNVSIRVVLSRGFTYIARGHQAS